ncbi:neuronal growth regulator 1-like, partial [Actinia tenebrosa]|uniref:Neuronal growth regulator 1-like n=1 Tax=Actinia tenebrosa TaxID=6105 RepID=A0A6P8H6J4_ACTTE
MPNVTWQKVQGDVINQSVGNVTIDITNITRYESGEYECCAINNLNKPPFCKSILVTVQYEPQIDVFQSNDTVSSYNGGKIRIYCLAHGVPSPLFTWYDPHNRSIATGSHTVTGVSVLELVTINAGSYGLYKCKAENLLGYDEHIINVTQTDHPPSLKPSRNHHGITTSSSQTTTGHESRTQPGERSCSTLFIQGRTFATVHFIITSISIGVNIIMALLVCYIFKRTGFKGK